MKTKNSHIYILMALALLALGHLAHCATITWNNPAGGNWSVAANWSPNQVPTNTDTALITTPGTYTVNLDVPGVVTNLTLGAGGGAAGLQTLVASNLLTVSSLLLVTNGGVLNVSGAYAEFTGGTVEANGGVINLAAGYYYFDFTVNSLIMINGGLVSASGEPLYGGYDGEQSYYGPTINGTVMVANGGVFDINGAIGPVTVANGGLMTAAGSAGALTVAHGGVLDITNGLSLVAPLINSGTINLTNAGIGLVNNDYSGGAGGLVNLPGGLINLKGSGGIEAGAGIGYFGYVTNQGIIIQISGTNSISVPASFDNSLGTITNLSGLLSLGLFQTNLAGTYFAAAGATIQFVGADIDNDNSAPQLTLGTPLVLAGGGQYQLTSGYLYLPSNVPTNLELLGDTVELGANFQGGAITNLSLYGMGLINALPITGTFTATNSNIGTNLVVANGGVFSYEGAGLINGTVAVESGGVFNVISSVGNSYVDILLYHGVTVAHGGIMNCEGYFTVTTLTNAGTLNLASQLVLYTTTNGIVNQPGGLINLESNAVITVAATNDYFINQGSIVQNAGAGATNSISYQKGILISGGPFNGDSIGIYEPFAFDNSQGTITNLSGTLVLASFPGTLAGNFYAAAGATIQLGGGTIVAPLVPGTPLVLGGSGQYQFISGYLFLAANVPANLSLQGGQLTLGASFQGGAITNLALDGITLTNQFPATLPITGTFTVMNSGNSGTLNNSLYGWAGFYGNGIYGNYSVAGSGVLNVSNAFMYGTVTVTNGGVLNASGYYNYFYGNLTIANGGMLNGTASMYGSVVVASGGALNPVQIELYGPLTNSGTINMTNSGIEFYNDGTTNYTGSLINQAGGLIEFFGNADIGGYGGYDYVVNEGRIIADSAGSGYTVFDTDNATNSGTITVQKGQLFLVSPWTLLPAGSLNVVLNSATNYGSVFFASHSGPVGASAVLAGAFNATLNNGYVPTNGTTFNVLTYGSFTGSFSSLGLPAAVTWQSNYGSTNFSLVAGARLPQFGTVNLLGTNFIFTGTGGPSGSNYVVLASTNLTLPLTNWLPLTTNIFDGSGQFHYTNHVSPVKPRQFFIFKLP
jgi:fibronectin-binding autotransporter adhesin